MALFPAGTARVLACATPLSQLLGGCCRDQALVKPSQGDFNPLIPRRKEIEVVHSSKSTGDRDWFFGDMWRHRVFQLNYFQHHQGLASQGV